MLSKLRHFFFHIFWGYISVGGTSSSPKMETCVRWKRGLVQLLLDRGTLAFCQGLAFDLCVSALPAEEALRKTARLRRKTRSARLSPPAVSHLPRSVLRLRSLTLALRACGLFLKDRGKPSL